MTRWLYYLFYFWLFTIIKICSIAYRICQNCLKVLPNKKYTLSKWPKYYNGEPRWRKFAKSGHTGRLVALELFPGFETSRLSNKIHSWWQMLPKIFSSSSIFRQFILCIIAARLSLLVYKLHPLFLSLSLSFSTSSVHSIGSLAQAFSSILALLKLW